ncbi:MAG: N4-gp56 family major capsid protein [Spirochaetes bacterium GWB1_59_5]|nr:MAG: N4-gp56 family major capsid protein [Spirochaetes bacterium GWB1_59_5]
MGLNVYGDISPAVAGYANPQFLMRALPYLVLEKYLDMKPLPSKSTKVQIFRRYEALAKALTPLVEGVTPQGKSMQKTDVQVTLQQYGDFVQLTDQIVDLHTDPVLQEYITITAEQAAQTLETLRYNVLKAGTNVFYANGTQRTDVNTALTLTLQRKVTRAFKRQNVGYITSQTASTPNYGTVAVRAGYIGLIHPDNENDVRAMAGFKDAVDYGAKVPVDSFEIGSVEDVRYIRSTIFESFPDAGGNKGTMISTSGVKADVYPVIYMGAHFAASTPLKGKGAITAPIVRNPGTISDSDKLGQRGHVGWKAYFGAIILNQLFGARAEVGATEL